MFDNGYLIFVVILFALAIFDLIVGVSNDAVNFLNSSIGSKVAKRKTILIIAGAGVLVGAIFSGGMMEVARKGIFNPEMFVFSELMVVFMAVMLTDIILLDMFNTFGMPTSTTVSIVFELLGAAFAISTVKILNLGQNFSELALYLNHSKAIQIIGGIFLSIFFAFAIGWLVMTLSRLVFSFNLNKSIYKYGSFFGGIALTIIVYFMLIKGAKGSMLISKENLAWVNENTFYLLLANFIFWTLVSFVIDKVFKFNILRFVVLCGTFALAMAFAGNDLVNFIGVPIAGFESYTEFISSGVAPDEFNMGFLSTKVKTNSYLLIIAGIIMVLTLVFSKKARSVTETEVNLGRQGFGSERFNPNVLSRSIVQFAVYTSSFFEFFIPKRMRLTWSEKFSEVDIFSDIDEEDKPAFDLLRASVNLMVASILIAFATSLKLPLSTTYVSFMVAMGASLADNAWDRESAVYRVAGVVNVIAGWLFTAVIAFTSASIMALLIYYGGIYMVIALTLLAVFLIARSEKVHRARMKTNQTLLSSIIAKKNINTEEVLRDCFEHITETLNTTDHVFKRTIDGLAKEDKKIIKESRKESKEQDHKIDQLSKSVFHYIQKMEDDEGEMSHFFIYILRSLNNIKKSIIQISTISSDHISNMHKPLKPSQIDELYAVSISFSEMVKNVNMALPKVDPKELKELKEKSDDFYEKSLLLIDGQIKRIKDKKSSRAGSVLQLSILLEAQNLHRYISDIAGLYVRHKNGN